MSNQPKSKSEMKRLNVAQGRDIAEGVNEFGKSEQSKPKDKLREEAEHFYDRLYNNGIDADFPGVDESSWVNGYVYCAKYSSPEANKSINALSAKCAELEELLSNKGGRFIETNLLRTEIESLRAQLAEKEIKINELEGIIGLLEVDAQNSQEHEERLQRHIDSLEDERPALEANRTSYIKSLLTEIESVKAQLSEKERELAEVKKNLADIQFEFREPAELLKKLAELEKQLGEKDAAYRVVVEQITETALENRALRADWVSMRAALEKLIKTVPFNLYKPDYLIEAEGNLASLKYKGE